MTGSGSDFAVWSVIDGDARGFIVARVVGTAGDQTIFVSPAGFRWGFPTRTAVRIREPNEVQRETPPAALEALVRRMRGGVLP